MGIRSIISRALESDDQNGIAVSFDWFVEVGKTCFVTNRADEAGLQNLFEESMCVEGRDAHRAT
ncbi:hypothetical protein N184_29360 [Sinorhizobium sp. GL28]|nr:hypothetical protein N184_29360 [Sinorhizobium sp. GL28]